MQRGSSTSQASRFASGPEVSYQRCGYGTHRFRGECSVTAAPYRPRALFQDMKQ